MAGAEITVIYPRPTDIETFERRCREEHVPMAMEKLVGKTKVVMNSVASPLGTPPFHRIAEIHLPSLATLQACLASPVGRRPLLMRLRSPVGETPSS